MWRREASNEQRLMCCVGLDVSLVLSATWVVYVCVARGTCASSELPESTRRVEGGSGPQPNFLEGAAPSDTGWGWKWESECLVAIRPRNFTEFYVC